MPENMKIKEKEITSKVPTLMELHIKKNPTA